MTTATATRIPLSVAPAVAITAALFLSIWTLIRPQEGRVIEVGPLKPPDIFTRLAPQEPPPPPEHRAKPLPPTGPGPEGPWQIKTTAGPGTRPPTPQVPFGTPGPHVTTTPMALNGVDADPIAVVHIDPDYPERARKLGIEGWVQIAFDITPSGQIANARVVDGYPQGTFDGNALKAVARWKYQPQIHNGVAVERRGMQVVLRFDLED